jgi:uncharacterized LabA/DUF88 family protein
VPTKPDLLRVMFFIDGQNVYHGCVSHFGHGNCHPHLFPNWFLGGTRTLAGVRFYTGIHDPRVDAASNAAMNRRLAAMQAHGVHTYTHPLLYSEAERVDHSVAPCEHGYLKVDTVRRGREKGIDLRIGLDMVRLARRGEYDVAVLVSQDSDLNQAVNELMLLRDELDIWLAVENPIPFDPTSGKPRFHLSSCRRYHVLTRDLFEYVRDDTDYSRPPHS